MLEAQNFMDIDGISQEGEKPLEESLAEKARLKTEFNQTADEIKGFVNNNIDRWNDNLPDMANILFRLQKVRDDLVMLENDHNHPKREGTYPNQLITPRDYNPTVLKKMMIQSELCGDTKSGNIPLLPINTMPKE